MKKFLIIFTILFLFPLNVFSQEEITVEELVQEQPASSRIEELDKKEEERSQQKANMLGFVLPEYSDNPSYLIVFQDPSSDQKGVEIEIDEKPFEKISSPYSFPALNIGMHNIRFRFEDENGYVQLLEYEFLIIPRPPIINTPEITDTTITVGGTSLPNSEVHFILTSTTTNKKDIVKVDANGNWIASIEFESGVPKEIFAISAYSRKYGYSSNLSDFVIFASNKESNNLKEDDNVQTSFSFKDLTKGTLKEILHRNKDLILLLCITIVITAISTLSIKGAFNSIKQKKSEKETEDIIKKSSISEEKTLREVFEEKEDKKTVKKEKIEKEKGKEKKKDVKKPKIVNRDMFLKDYKHVDPDTDSGKEIDDKDIKENIKISLTSKKEE